MDVNADNKLNMSLDEIIKKERKAKQQRQQGGLQGAARRRRVVVTKRNIKGNKSNGARSALRKNRPATGGNLTAAAAMKVVNKLVNQAIRRRANQSLINRAAILRRRAVRRSVAVRPAVRGMRARRQAAVIGTRLAGRLSGVSRQSRIIGRTRLARRQQPVIISSPQIVRGRGVSRLGQLISDNEAVVVEERQIARPIRQRQRVVQQQPRRRRQIIVERRTRPVIVEQRPVIIRRGGIRKRVVVDDAPGLVVVRNGPRRQTQFRTEPVFKRAQRVVNIQQPRNRIVRTERRGQFAVNPNAAQMRKALGIGVRSEPQRFESSSTFLQRVPATNRRGRGFQTVVYE